MVVEKIVGVWLNGFEHQHRDGAIHSHKHDQSYASRPMLTNLLFGAAIHSFIDGIALGTAYSTGTQLEVITTVAVQFTNVRPL